MMASAGVSVGGGAGMLRTRRRDVSVKPNRKLDRKSSRGMIYENEELRLRTIHINAEVEQGQNDIKKLRRENEQLRREIWSLRDEYDKLEEILKRQKNHDESEEYEDRSEDDEAPCSSNSSEEDEELEEEDVEEEDEEGNDRNQEERLENAENQKISSEKMNGSGLHRLHVDFDDLSVVDEEEELKKDKERKESNDGQSARVEEPGNPLLSIGPRQLHENIPFYPANYQPPSAFTDTNYFAECPFEFSRGFDPILSTDTPTLLASPCPRIYGDPMIPLTALDPSGLSQTNDKIAPNIHVPPVGWQDSILHSERQTSNYAAASPIVSIPTSTTMPVSGTFTPPIYPDTRQDYRTLGAPMSFPSSSFQSSTLPQRRNISLRQGTKLTNVPEIPNLHVVEGTKMRDDWNILGSPKKENNVVNDQLMMNSITRIDGKNVQGTNVSSSTEKPKHFFAPLPLKVKRQEEDSPTASTTYFGTGTSSSSGRTGSTVIRKSNQFVGGKGCADVCVNGAIPFGGNVRLETDEQKTFLSTDNLLIGDNKNSNQLIKSMSCQDLTSDSQNMCISEQFKMNLADGRPQLTKSDNTLDNVASGTTSRPYKTQLNVTLKMPQLNRIPSPETPEIPKLPSIDYKLFKNPFLKKYEQDRSNFPDRNSPITRPLSIQVNDSTNQQYRNPTGTTTTGYERGFHFDDKYVDPRAHVDHNRLLIPTDQLINGKITLPVNKQEIQVTSFEKPSPHAVLPSAIPYDLDTLRRLTTSRYYQNQHLYQNIPFVPRGPPFYQRDPMRMYYDTITKVPAQTQTSIDGDSHHEDDRYHQEETNASAPNSPSGQRRKKATKKEKTSTKELKPLSPAAQRRLRKQSSVTSSEVPDSPGKSARHRPRKLSVTTTTTSDAPEDKNESRSSSSGQDSPRKDQARRVSIYFNAKKRPSLASVKTTRSSSLDASKDTKDKYVDGNVTNSERERTNSISSRETAKTRKTSTSSGSVPWCACWGNGCI